MECNFAFVNFRPAVHVVDYASKHAVGGGTGFDWSLTRAGTIHGKEADAVGQNGGETFSEIFFAAVEPIDGNHEWNWAGGVLGEAEISDHFFSFKGDLNNL